MGQRVFVDANVLVDRTIRDWTFLLRFAGSGSMYELHSTEDVLAEAVRAIRRRHPTMSGGAMSKLRERFVRSLDGMIDEFDATIDYRGVDPHDRHVHAAAVAGKADKLLTADKSLLALRDDDDCPYEVLHPDDFFVLIDDSSPHIVRDVTHQQRLFWADQPRHVGLVPALQKAHCPTFAVRVETHLKWLAGL